MSEQARAGEIKNMTGIGSPYEAPLKPEMVLNTDGCSVAESCDKVFEYLKEHGYLRPPSTVAPGRMPPDGSPIM